CSIADRMRVTSLISPKITAGGRAGKDELELAAERQSSAARGARGSLARPEDVVADRLRVVGPGEAGATALQVVHGWVRPFAPAGEPGGCQVVAHPVQRGRAPACLGVLRGTESGDTLCQQLDGPLVLGVAAFPFDPQRCAEQFLGER